MLLATYFLTLPHLNFFIAKFTRFSLSYKNPKVKEAIFQPPTISCSYYPAFLCGLPVILDCYSWWNKANLCYPKVWYELWCYDGVTHHPSCGHCNWKNRKSAALAHRYWKHPRQSAACACFLEIARLLLLAIQEGSSDGGMVVGDGCLAEKGREAGTWCHQFSATITSCARALSSDQTPSLTWFKRLHLDLFAEEDAALGG